MVAINTLVKYCDDILESPIYKDASYNGLQIQGRNEIKCIASATSASLEAINEAIAAKADALIVHHGLFWKGADPRIIGSYFQRVKALIDNNINLIAYHLPMDANLTFGNNAYLAKLIDAHIIDYVEPNNKNSIALNAVLEQEQSVSNLAKILAHKLQSEIKILGNYQDKSELDSILLSKLLICSGSGSSFIDNDKCPAFQALITGDVNEQTLHMAKESNTIVFVLGHHASEQGAIHNFAHHLKEHFQLEHKAINFNYELDCASFTPQ